jgi:hypothetical protein
MKTTTSCLRQMLRATAIPALACAGLLQACASPVTQQDAVGFQAQLRTGDYTGAANTAMRSGQISPDGESRNIVWSLNAGAALFDAGDAKGSVAVLENTERLMQADDLDTMRSALDYKFTTYDGVMANTYKALASLEQGDGDNARVEFRRAEDRQRRAEEYFQREASASQRQLAHAKSMDAKTLFNSAEQSSDYQGEISNLSQMAAAYAPFENPFSTYLGGIFLLAERDGTASDREAGLHKLQRASGALGPDGASIRSDLIWARGVVSGVKTPPQTWVVFENGQSATFREMRLVLPMVTGHPMTLAIPALYPNAPASAHLNVQAGGVTTATSLVGSFDAVMASEFRKRMPVILTGVVVEAALKNGVSIAAQKSNNVMLRLISDVAANVSTADTRSWTALPKEFQAVRVVTPADGRIALTTAEGTPVGTIQVPTDRPSIIYVKMQCAGAKPSLQVIKL